MRRLDERRLLERADRATLAVGAKHVDPESLLVQPDPDLGQGVCAGIRRGNESGGGCIRERQPDLQRDHTCSRIIVRHVDRRDDHKLAGSDAHEVDQRHLLGEGSAQRAVIRLVDRASAIVVEDRAARRIDVVVIRRRLTRRVRCGQQRQRGRTGESPWAIDPVLERAKAPTLAGEGEALE